MRIIGITLAALLLLGADCASLAQSNSVAGEYACASMGGRPCQTGTALELTANGNWRWGRYNGKFQVTNGSIDFDGYGGPATWGSAAVGSNSLTFASGQQQVVFRKSSTASATPAPGVYYCRTAPRGCQTSRYIEIRSDGQWNWGPLSPHPFTVVGGKILFGTPLTDWGPADVGNGTLTFHSEEGDSVWSQQAGGGTASGGQSSLDPNVFDMGCPLQPFDRQRILAGLPSAQAPGASNMAKADAHERLAEFCVKVGDTKRAQDEHQRAQYWRNGGHW